MNQSLKALDVDVINFILQNDKATIEDLCNCFEVSPVNIRNVLAKISSFVENNNLGIFSKSNGYYYFENNKLNLDFDFKKFIPKDLEKKERNIYIILKLILENSINLSSISKELNISRITLNSDLEFIKNFIKDFDLSLVSIQWRGVFLKGEIENLQKFSILFIAKLYIENYFSSNLKKSINPILLSYFRKFLSQENENIIFNLVNKIYHYFDIKLGVYHYFILGALLIQMHLNLQKNINPYPEFQSSSLNFYEALNELLEDNEKALIGNNLIMIENFISQCINKNYSIIFSKNIDKIINEIQYLFNLEKEEFSILSFIINDIYFENRFFIPTYVKIDKEEEKIFEEEISKKLIEIFKKYNFPFNKKNISFLYFYLKNIINKKKRTNLLIIDNSSLNWKGNKIKEKLKYFENIDSIEIISYFNFKTYPIEIFTKYDIFIFIDLYQEKNSQFNEKKCYFINSYDFFKNIIDFSEII